VCWQTDLKLLECRQSSHLAENQFIGVPLLSICVAGLRPKIDAIDAESAARLFLIILFGASDAGSKTRARFLLINSAADIKRNGGMKAGKAAKLRFH